MAGAAVPAAKEQHSGRFSCMFDSLFAWDSISLICQGTVID
jgi:hypothetical protein